MGKLVKVASRARLRLTLTVSLLFLVCAPVCYCGSVVLLSGWRPHPNEEKQIRDLAEFYGLQVRVVDVRSPRASHETASLLKESRTLALLAPEDAISALDRAEILKATRKPGTRDTPMLVFGLYPGDPELLNAWSEGGVRDCAASLEGFRPVGVHVSKSLGLGGVLGGRDLPAVSSPVCDLRLADAGAQSVLTACTNTRSASVLALARTKDSDVYFAPELKTFDTSWIGDPRGLPGAFSSMAPFALFLAHAAGDYAWHLDGHYANLTIDDPWLRQPYGNLDYEGLISEMERHNFHTTIAFVPWNFDRSEPKLVALIRAHGDRYSISIHGNSHIHREFDEYRKNPLPRQIADIKQAVARMDRFKQITGLPYDRFMVFPHGVAPARTFAALREYDFLGTANSLNVPLDSKFPSDPIFLLRPYTSRYKGLLSLFRYSATERIPELEIAIHSFLGNPLLFYGHEDLFASGIGAFNPFAEFVNRTQPDTHWTSLGNIARHLYLLRRRDDGDFQVRMFSNEMDLRNPTRTTAVFHIEREEQVSPAIRSITIDGAVAPFVRDSEGLNLDTAIPAGQTRKIRVLYSNDFDPKNEKVGNSGLYEWTIRRTSDLRDIYLSRFPVGRALTRAYYRGNWRMIAVGVERYWALFTICFGLVLAGAWYGCLRHRYRPAKRIA
jgi:hypothetical protein